MFILIYSFASLTTDAILFSLPQCDFYCSELHNTKCGIYF